MSRRLLREKGERASVNGMWLAMRRKRDGFTRIEVGVGSGTHLETNSFGEGSFVLYLTDDERRELAEYLRPRDGPNGATPE